MSNKHMIANVNNKGAEVDDDLYWSNAEGWVEAPDADTFSQAEREAFADRLPIEGVWITLHDALRIRQTQEWGDSVFLTPEEFAAALPLKYARYTALDGSKIDSAAQVESFRKAYPDAVPYKCGQLGDRKAGFDGTGYEFLGLRLGFDGCQYMSF